MIFISRHTRPGICSFRTNAFFLAAGGAIFLILAIRTRVEEANLLSRFGEDYRKHMGRTGRFFPRCFGKNAGARR